MDNRGDAPTSARSHTAPGVSNRRRVGHYLGRWTMLFIGITALALGMSLVVRAELGAGPWTVFHLGLAQRTGFSVGRITQLVGVAIVGLTVLLLRQRPGTGTLVNMILVGFLVDMCLGLVDAQPSLLLRVLYLAVGAVLTGMGSAIYITADLGAGPRDGLMMGLHFLTGRSIRLIRTVLEVSALLTGAALGGRVGIGTVVVTLSIGPTIQFFMGIARALAPWKQGPDATRGAPATR